VSTSNPAVIVEGVSKTFRVPHEQTHTLKERVMHLGRKSTGNEFQALKDINFTVEEGEFFGIVGRNGSGKSTLLKLMAGIYRADEGTVRVRGRVSTFIELGVGFNPDLAARDNVLINGIMLGLTPREALARFDDVIAFAELEEFVDLKVKNYSSGMHVRLAFSVMAQVDADVLMIDEVLAVGDASFQEKCFRVFQKLRDEGKTILFVTHDMGAVKSFCHRALLLEHGEMRLIGEPARVGNHYLELNFGRDHTEDGMAIEAGDDRIERFGTQQAQVLEAWFEDEHGEPTKQIKHGRPMSFCVRILFHEAILEPHVACLLENEHHVPLFATSNINRGVWTGQIRPGEECLLRITMETHFTKGRIYATPWVMNREATSVLDRCPRITSVMVTAIDEPGGVVNFEHDLTWLRAQAATPALGAP
jgi:ABC-type polysaccharide/polyol phosphate transport system ATPase subunit